MEREVAKFDGATLNSVLCTKCGLSSQSFLEERWLCADITARVDAVLGVSSRLRSWEGVCTKLTRLFCLNEAERQSGFEAGDEIVEEGDGYCIVKDSRGLLLIVVHDQDSVNLLARLKMDKKKPKIIVMDIER